MNNLHGCQHTEEGSRCCDECEYFGVIPKIRHVEVKDSDGRKNAFSNFLHNISRIKIGEVYDGNRDLIDTLVGVRV